MSDSPSGFSFDEAMHQGLQAVFPPVMIKLLHALLEPSPSFTAVADFIRMDPLLTGTVLQIVNSSIYGFSEKITDVERAIIAIGTADMFKLALSLSLQKRMRPVPKRLQATQFRDWRLVVWSALAGDALAGYLCREERKKAYLAGMLKDIALLLAFCQDAPPEFLINSLAVTLSPPAQTAAELSCWGGTHADLAHDFLIFWGLPDDLAQAVKDHHDLNNVMDKPPLTQCVIYATRWAELLHAPEKNVELLVSFEMSLAHFLGISTDELQALRSKCAEQFELTTKQLGIREAAQEPNFHDQSLALIQNFHFLVQEALAPATAYSLANTATVLQRQLRIFWKIPTWECFLCLPDKEQGSFFRCSEGVLSPETWVSPGAIRPSAGFISVPIAASGKNLGFLALSGRYLSGQSRVEELQLFAHVFGLHFLERGQLLQLQQPAALADMPLSIALLNRQFCAVQATDQFYTLFEGEHDVPRTPLKNLLANGAGISLPGWSEAAGQPEQTRGWVVFPRKGSLAGKALSLTLTPTKTEDTPLLLCMAEVSQLSHLQRVALAYDGFLDGLFAALPLQVFMVDVTGVIFWAAPGLSAWKGKNIFALTKPLSEFTGPWNRHLLEALTQPVRLRVALSIVKNSTQNFELSLRPLGGGGVTLLVIRAV